jgi:spermidine synthase
VDLNEDVFRLAPNFAKSNLGVLDDPRVFPILEDGRHYLATQGDSFDVISLEPPPPETEGAATLYTREFYEVARRRLVHGGILAQWIPLDQQSDALDRSLLRTILDVFPEVNVFLPSRVEAVVLASDRPLRMDLDAWRARWMHPSVRANLEDVGFRSPEELSATLVLDTCAVREYVGDATGITDDLPVVEYYRSASNAPFALESLLALAVDPVTKATGLAVEQVEQIDRATVAERLRMRATRRWNAKDYAGASQLVAESAEVGGASSYTDYLRDVELDCLNVENP